MKDKKEIVSKPIPVSFKFPQEVKDTLDKLSKKQLRSQTQTLIFLITEAAKKENIK